MKFILKVSNEFALNQTSTTSTHSHPASSSGYKSHLSENNNNFLMKNRFLINAGNIIGGENGNKNSFQTPISEVVVRRKGKGLKIRFLFIFLLKKKKIFTLSQEQ